MAKTPDRANLVARLEGGDGPTLLLMAHTDTVLADPTEWSRDPWSGDLVDGEIWGRGALDMKGHAAAAAVAFASLARDGVRPSGDVLLALTADEEVGVDFGTSWLAIGAPGRRARGRRAQRGRRRAVRPRRPRVLPLRGRGEGDGAVPDPAPGPERARLGSSLGRQRADQGRAGARRARPARAAALAHP